MAVVSRRHLYIPLDHIILIAVFLRGHPHHFTELLYEMALR